LGALYLGGASAAALADAGLVTEASPGAAAKLTRALRSERDPASPRSF
jgi:hypothetical protein